MPSTVVVSNELRDERFAWGRCVIHSGVDEVSDLPGKFLRVETSQLDGLFS